MSLTLCLASKIWYWSSRPVIVLSRIEALSSTDEIDVE